jgi:transglutaminase-like putative cysteine protease
VALVLPLVSVVLMFALFLVLPRARHPLLPFFQSQATAAGLNDRVVPGALASPEGKGRPVFRVETLRLPPGELYWRGVVLSRLRDGAWLRDLGLREDAEVRGGAPVRQIFYPEPGPGPFLPALDLPVDLTGTPNRRGDDFVFAAPGNFRRIRYAALSRRSGRLEVREDIDRGLYLQVPSAVSPRVAEAAASVAAGGGDREKIARLEAFFLSRRLTYSLNTPSRAADPVDDFLFVSRRGWCEHFAASFALMLRLAGVPSRLVGGYYGGDYNELGGYYLVTEEMAHLWVEALVDGREWVRLDPTRLGREAAGAQGGGLGPGRRLLDAVDYYWNRMVIGYDLDRQMDVLREAGERAGRWRPDLSSLGWVLGGGGVLLLLPAVLGYLRRRGTREERLLRRYQRCVTRRYSLGELSPTTGLQELAIRVGDPACHEFAEIFGGAVYRDRPLTEEEYRRLNRLVGEVGRERG